MSEPFLSEIKIVSFNFPPKGWALCNGQFLPINQNQALFSLLGTTYGGNGQTTFALPNLRGRVPIHFGAGHTLGESGGAGVHHDHHAADAGAPPFRCRRRRTPTATQAIPTGNLPGARRTTSIDAPTNLTTLHAGDGHQRRRQPAARRT